MLRCFTSVASTNELPTPEISTISGVYFRADFHRIAMLDTCNRKQFVTEGRSQADILLLLFLFIYGDWLKRRRNTML